MRGSDRKSTRLNSSHEWISYAVFCLGGSHPLSPLFPYTTLFRSDELASHLGAANAAEAMQAYGADSRNYFLSRDDIVRAASEQVERAWVRLPEFFRRLPSASCVVQIGRAHV